MDRNTTLVFETIGLIKRSLQCSICLDLFNDPHSTRCNHQFCSRCIRKVVDDRKDKKQEALCPLCKNPITKRSLTSNPRLKEIVDVVRRLNNAFQEDAGVSESPYPLVNSRSNGESNSYLQFVRSNPTPLKPAKFKSPTLNAVTAEQTLDSRANQQPSKYDLRSRGQSGPKNTTGIEILSLLESEEDALPESRPTRYIDDVEDNDDTLEETWRSPGTGNNRISQPTESHAEKSQENVNTANTKSSGSITIDYEKSASSQFSVLSNKSVSMLDGLLSQHSQHSNNEMEFQDKDICETGVDVSSGKSEEVDHSPTQEISKPQVEENDNSLPDACNLERAAGNSLNGNCISSNDVFNEFSESSNDKLEIRRTAYHVGVRKNASSPSKNASKSTLVEETSEQYSSERVPASVDSDSQSYRVISLPRYQELHSDDDLSPEFPNPTRPDEDECSAGEKIIPSAENAEGCSQAERLERSTGVGVIENEQRIPLLKSSNKNGSKHDAENCKNSEEFIRSSSGNTCHQQKSKRRHSPEDTHTCRKYPRLSNEAHVSRDIMDKNNETCQQGGERSGQDNADVEDEDDIIPPTPPAQMDAECDLPKKTNVSVLGPSSPSRNSRLRKVSEMLREDELPDDDDVRADDEGEMMVDGGRSPIIVDEDGNYSSQEDLLFREDEPGDEDNVAVLRRLAPGSASHNESDDEISDCKTVDTTSISSLTDGDANGVEISSQRIKYLHDVVAQTGGEIEKLTADLKNLRKNEVIEEPVKTKQSMVGSDKKNGMATHLGDKDINYVYDSSSDKEDGPVNGLDENGGKEDFSDRDQVTSNDLDKNDELVSDRDSNSETEVKNFKSLGEDSDASESNIDGNDDDDCELSDKDEKEDEKESNKEKSVVDDDDDDSVDDDDEIQNSLSPPPSLEHSSLQLTKLPAAIKNMQKLLQQDDESEDELEVTDNHSSRQTLLDENPTAELEVIFDNKRSCDAPANTTDYRVSERGNKSADVQDARNRTRPEGSQKENSPRLEQRSASRPIATRRPLDISRQDSQLKEHARPSPSHGVLTEMRPNTGSKQRALSSMLANELQHETRRSPQSALSSFCFVVTRLPKQFVSLAGYLAKRNGGKMSADVTEETTHVIMPTDSKMHASRNNYTLKYLLGIALGKWIVSQLWITACVKSGRLVDEEQYEVKGDIEAAQSRVPHLARTTRENKSPLLFQSISVVCIGEFSGAISLHQVCQLTRYCGGRVVDFAEEFMKSSNTVSDLIVICGTISEERTEFQIKELCKRYSTFPVSAEWVTDSVANYQLQDIEEYRTDI